MIIQEIVERTTQFFRGKNIASPRLDAELLIASVLHLKRIDLYLKFDRPLSEDEVNAARELVRRRSSGEPVAYILGKKDFYGFEFLVDQTVLIPRPETELLVESAISFLSLSPGEGLIADWGSGSGCVGLSIIKKVPAKFCIFVDSSSEALEICRKNAGQLGVIERCHFVCSKVQDLKGNSDWLGLTKDRNLELIVANPPYIAKDDQRVEAHVRKFEPSCALFADEDGFQEIASWAAVAASISSFSGRLGFEIGNDQGDRAHDCFCRLGFKSVKIAKDLSNFDRFVWADKEM